MAASETRQDCGNEDRICWSPMLCKSIGRCQKASKMDTRTEYYGAINLGWTIVRNESWSAIDRSAYDGASTKGITAAVGWGATEAEAIADLKAQLGIE